MKYFYIFYVFFVVAPEKLWNSAERFSPQNALIFYVNFKIFSHGILLFILLWNIADKLFLHQCLNA